jgi:hypothetical protein
LRHIYDALQDPMQGPVYTHCWNGWHASGSVAAVALRQFCGMAAEDAVKYWDRNTDGNNKEPQFERIRQRVREFEPDPALMLSPEQQREYCPAR